VNRLRPEQERLRSHVEALSEPRCPSVNRHGHGRVKQQLLEMLGAIGGDVRVEPFWFDGSVHENLVVDLPGEAPDAQREVVVVGAHYDSAPDSPGADDNGSALAALLEIGRSLAPVRRRHDLRLVAFDLEETDFRGSRHHAAQCVWARRKIRLMLSLEMLGYCSHEPGSQWYPGNFGKILPDRGDFIGLLCNLRAVRPTFAIAQGLRSADARTCALPTGVRGEWIPASCRSDHVPFWELGYPAMLVTDTGELRNPHYHQPTDVPKTLDYEFLESVSRGLATGISRLVGAGPT
jgi:Peptidase family M28